MRTELTRQTTTMVLLVAIALGVTAVLLLIGDPHIIESAMGTDGIHTTATGKTGLGGIVTAVGNLTGEVQTVDFAATPLAVAAGGVVAGLGGRRGPSIIIAALVSFAVVVSAHGIIE